MLFGLLSLATLPVAIAATRWSRAYELLDAAFAPDARHWLLGPDGCWERRPADGEPARDVQADLVRRTAERGAGG